MKKRLIIFLCLNLILILSGCKGDYAIKHDYDINQLYEITYNDDITCDYVVKDKNDNIIISDKGISREPWVNVINEDLLSLSVQAGTGISTRWTKYCNVNSGKVSDTYVSVLGECGENVIFVDYDNGIYYVVVQNIFDIEKYHKSIVLEDARMTDPVVSFEKLDGEKVKIGYVKSEEYTETEIIIELN